MKSSERHTKVELLAPARNREAAVAAVDFGADAVYMGAAGFGARAAAGNALQDIAAAAEYAHRYHARLYVTLNTLLRDDEIPAARTLGREVLEAGADALIVQDMAWLRMGLEGVEFHASTQTYNDSPEKVRFLAESGFSRVILERGLTLERIKAIRSATDAELECFVYGAVCVGGSGRCYLSRSMGPRSGNRGNCAQPCRLKYDLTDGRGRRILRDKHLLSLRDLDLTDRLGDLLDAGVTSFKIEGRLKDISYVRNSVALLRRALDAEIALRPGFCKASAGVSVPPGKRTSEYAAAGISSYDFEPHSEKGFSRGKMHYVFDGSRTGMASFDSPKSVGMFAGTVKDTGKKWFRLDGGPILEHGDGVCFMADGVLAGTRVNVGGEYVYPDSMIGIEPGVRIYRNYDRRHDDALRKSCVRRVIPVRISVSMSLSEIVMHAEDAQGYAVDMRLEGEFPPAFDPERMLATVRDASGRSGREPFLVYDVEAGCEGTVPFLPQSALSDLRRRCLDELLEARSKGRPLPRPRPENVGFPCPWPRLGPQWNVTNRLAEKFYRDHGATVAGRGYDSGAIPAGAEVMRSPYCIRREIGECLKENPRCAEPLFLVRGGFRYRLKFDCRECTMSLVYEPVKPVKK